MKTLIITEKSSQAKDLRAALGDRFGQILPAEGHLLRLAEPEEVNAEWKRWSCTLLKPDGLYPTRPAADRNKPSKLKAIAMALKTCDQVILATDCDREGQLIGQEIIDYLAYRGRVQRALFTAQDPKTLRQAFAQLKPNGDLRPLYEAAVARQQADQIFNLSLTRTATKTLLGPGVRGVIGIGRVKTPTLGIVCLRELEIRNFRPEDYFEIVATATVATGSFSMRHAPAANRRITDRLRAEAIARAAAGHKGQLGVSVEHRRQGSPRLFDLPALQKTCGQRWGWNADKTLSVAQELYDGDGKKLITYPRAEARYLSENQIGDVPAIVGALVRLRGFAHIEVGVPVIRRGKSGHFYDKGLEGVAHHAVIPNVNVLDDLEQRLGRLGDDEKRLFALICRSYLVAVMPDYEYRQTVATINVPVPGGPAAEFRATGRIPLRLGWKTVYGALPQEQDGDSEPEQTLPPLSDGEAVTLTDPKVEAKRTQPPPRYSEGTLVEAMQNAWRFVNDPGLRERLKEAKGIGTPATRAEIIKGLKRQNLLAADGKFVVPTSAGLQVFQLLRGAAPSLVDPATTATWEMQLDDIVSGRTDFRAVIDGIATMAGQLIEVLRGHPGSPVDLSLATAAAGRGRRQPRAAARRRLSKEPSAARAPRQRRSAKHAQPPAPAAIAPQKPPNHSGKTGMPPTAKMVAYAKSLAGNKKVKLPPGYAQDFETCRRFLDQHSR
ncbi:MAG TPA: DNA topoisomerase [Stellaceae bacterium]